MTNDELKTRLDDLGKKLEQRKQELQQRGIFRKEHQITQEELDARYRKLKTQLDEEVNSLESTHQHVSVLEKAILKWMNAIDLDSQ